MAAAELAGLFFFLAIIFLLNGILSKNTESMTLGIIFLIISAVFQRFYNETDFQLEEHHRKKQKQKNLKQKYFEKYGEKW